MAKPSHSLPELEQLEALIKRAKGALRAEVLGEVGVRGERLPVYCVELGSTAPQVPAVGFFGGVHGVERIGAQVVLAYLHTLVERLHWDELFAQMLSQVRLVFMPLVNPGGMRRLTRSNPQGIDLMRNAPVDADHRAHWLVGGQRLTRHLPWYRGRRGAPMAPEAQMLYRVVEERLFPHAFSLAMDCHSGFGTRDRIWFPYARSRQPIDCLAEVFALRTLFRNTYPHHSIYVIEPQSRQYTTHGDLWDHLYDRSRSEAQGLFMPFTLELGSWLWVKKNPWQLLALPGMFNPIEPHRELRILRQHLTLFDFLVRAAVAHPRWRPIESIRPWLHDSAVAYWSQPRR
ncbi:MAG: DUF2817 domain-containing protein [Nevskiaceae bacterium]|nr:MAG: DUF2817 domain-containing protein [Nevskiaceae bacterium]